VASNM